MFRDSWPKSHPLEPRTPVYHITWVPPPPPPPPGWKGDIFVSGIFSRDGPGKGGAGPWEAGVLGCCSTPGKKIRGCAAPPGNFHEPKKCLKFWRKGSNIDERTDATPVFFFFFFFFFFWGGGGGLVREVGDVRSSIGTPTLCVENWPKEIWGRKKMCQSSLPWILTSFNSLENRFFML